MCLFFKQKTAYEMRISDWSSDVCSSDLLGQEVYIALTKADTGRGIVAGVSVAFIAIIADRLIAAGAQRARRRLAIGSASCRERVCQYVSISVVAVSLKKKK